jgi:hypothetical protein
MVKDRDTLEPFDYDDNNIYNTEYKGSNSILTPQIMIICMLGIFCIVMYMLGKQDGREDALKSNIINCATVLVVEDS